MKNTLKKRMQKFTIVEVVVAMAVFSILMLLVMQIFGSLQNVWTTTSKGTQTAQNANIIMNMIANDLQSAYYDIEADGNSSWCYYQSSSDLKGLDKPLWFITSRPKSVQSSNSAQVQTGYYLQEVKKDGADYTALKLYALKNLVISNVNYDGVSEDLYNFRRKKEPDDDLKTITSELDKKSVLIDDNILSLTITPYYWDSTGKKYEPVTSFVYQRLPRCVKIELVMLDDDVSVREAFENNDADRNLLKRKYTRVIEINRGQQY